MAKSSKKPKSANPPAAQPATQAVGKDEMNLAEFPIGKLGVRDNRESLTYEGWLTDKSGKRFKQKWVVSGSKEYGLPHELGNRILVAFITLAAELQTKKVPFVDHQILKLLHLSRGRSNYRHLERNLLQLAGLTIYSEQAFWDNEQQRHITTKRAFHIFEDVWLSSWIREGERGPKGHGYVVFNEVFWRNIESGYLKTLNMELYLGRLRSSVARQLYRCLDKLMRYRRRFEIDIFDLASRIGLREYPYPSQVKEKLQPALRELTKIGFLESVEFVKVDRYTRVRFVKASGKPADLDAQLELASELASEVANEIANEIGNEVAHTPAPPPSDAGVADPWAQTLEEYPAHAEFEELWQAVLRGLQAAVPPATYYTFIEQTRLVAIAEATEEATEGPTAVILTANPAALDWLQHRFANQFKSELNYHLRAAGQDPVTAIRIEVLPA